MERKIYSSCVVRNYSEEDGVKMSPELFDEESEYKETEWKRDFYQLCMSVNDLIRKKMKDDQDC